jgi:hypothetical protein
VTDAEDKMRRRVAEARLVQDLGLIPTPHALHPSCRAFYMRQLEKKRHRKKIKYRPGFEPPKPPKKARKPQLLPLTPGGRQLLSFRKDARHRMTIDDMVKHFGFPERSDIVYACKLGLLPWPIRHDGRAGNDRRWSKLSILAFDHWKMSSRKAKARRVARKPSNFVERAEIINLANKKETAALMRARRREF